MNTSRNRFIKVLKRYLKLNFFTFFCINVAIYVVALYVELNYLYSKSYYFELFANKFNSQKELLKEFAAQKSMDIYHYLWIPVHVLLSCFLIGICIFLGLNIMNIRIRFKESLKMVMACTIIFPINYLITVILKISHIISFNEYNIDDEYAYQSIAALFDISKIPVWEYAILRQINITEISFILFLSLALSIKMHINFLRGTSSTAITYIIGLIIYGIVSVFAGYILIN